MDVMVALTVIYIIVLLVLGVSVINLVYLIYLTRDFYASLHRASNKADSIAKQIDRIGREAKEEMDQVSDEYIRQVFEQMKKGEK